MPDWWFDESPPVGPPERAIRPMSEIMADFKLGFSPAYFTEATRRVIAAMKEKEKKQSDYTLWRGNHTYIGIEYESTANHKCSPVREDTTRWYPTSDYPVFHNFNLKSVRQSRRRYRHRR